jgi:hypothetical protein
VRTIISITSAICVLEMTAFSEANQEKVRVRQIGQLNSIIADSLHRQMDLVPLTLNPDSSVLLQGETMSRLKQENKDDLKATYQAGYTIVLLDATMEHVNALHELIGAGVTYSSKDGDGVLAYALRHENHIPTATLLSKMHPSLLRTSLGDPDPTDVQNERQAYKRAVEMTVSELGHRPNVTVRQLHDPNQPVDWQSIPVQKTVFQQGGAAGVYNTTVNVYALHSCQADTRTKLTSDYYMVTALADWTATNAKFESAATELGPSSMYYDNLQDKYVVNWRDDPKRTYCSSPGAGSKFADICRYSNYPLQYDITMIPQNTGSIVQTDAKPPATQGQATTYTSGFMFNLGGTVNVSGKGPQAGLSAGATWNNMTATTVPPLELDLSQTDKEGAQWTFKYCTGGEEPDPGTNCTSHVQTAKDVCRAQLGDDSGTNPQQGQTPKGAFTDAVQTALWQAGPDTRTGRTTFDIEVAVTPTIGVTTANLWNVGVMGLPQAGCNGFSCDCVSNTTTSRLPGGSYTFQIPLPSLQCE